MTYLQTANEYLTNTKHSVNGQFRLQYHMSPPVGWMNDPNGLICYGGKYHLFYQYNPYSTTAGVMHWGHFISDDLICFKDAEIAIAPDEEGESIFSGGAVEIDGGIAVYYTRHYELGGVKSEEVHLAVSNDGVRFKKYGRVFDNADLPENISKVDFRDPCPVLIDGKYYVFVGGKDVNLNAGLIVVLGGEAPDKLDYLFTIGPFYELGDMGECPSYCRVDGKDVILASGCNVPLRGNDFKNVNSSVFIVGKIDFEKGGMQVELIKEIDKGDTFYAPQVIRGAEKPIIVGWLEMWGKPYPTNELKHGWVGAFSIPRELKIKDGDVFQTPVASLSGYCKDSLNVPRCADISFTLGGRGSVTFKGDNGSFTVGSDGAVYLDTMDSNNMNGCVRTTNNEYRECSVRVLLDVSSVEVFVDGGRETISSRIYIDGNFTMTTQGEVADTEIKEIGRY